MGSPTGSSTGKGKGDKGHPPAGGHGHGPGQGHGSHPGQPQKGPIQKPAPPPPPPAPKKPYEEISAVFNGNEVKIRVPKSRCKPQKLTPSQTKLMDQCTCAEGEDVCPEDCGFGGAGNDENQLLFQIPDDLCEASNQRTSLNSQLVYSKKQATNTMCDFCDVTPGNAPRGVQAKKGLNPDKDVFLLKIGKQTDEPNRTGNIEVELITPKAPAKQQPAPHACKNVQCEADDIPCCIPRGQCRAAPNKRRSRLRRPSYCRMVP